MTVSDIGSIGELVGALATVGTLIYVALQIRENTAWTKQQALDTALDKVTGWTARLNENPQLLEIYLSGREGYEAFEEKEKYQYGFIMIEILGAMESGLEHGKTGAVKPEVLDSARRWIARELEPKGARLWWEEVGRDRCSSDLVHVVDEILNEKST